MSINGMNENKVGYIFGIEDPRIPKEVNLEDETAAFAGGVIIGEVPLVGNFISTFFTPTVAQYSYRILKHTNKIRHYQNQLDAMGKRPYKLFDPLVLDLNRDGKIDLDNMAIFDLNASGFHEMTRWINETDAFLVIDINENGVIDNGREMFGDAMVLPDGSLALCGFNALTAYDSNGDGKIDVNDEIFSSLKLLTGAGQLITLSDAGVKSITIPPTSETPNNNNTILTQEQRIRQDYERWLNGGDIVTESSFEWEDGTEGTIAEVLPYRIPMYSIPDAAWDVPEEIAALPNVYGNGVLYDLQQIMAIDGSGDLRGILEQYMAEKDPKRREEIVSQLLLKWAGVDGINPNSRGGLIDARKVAFLEAYMGEPFEGVGESVNNSHTRSYIDSNGNEITLADIQLGNDPNNTAAPILKGIYASIVREIDAALLVQTHLKPFFDEVEVEITEPVLDSEGNVVEQGTISISFDPAIQWLGELASRDLTEAVLQVSCSNSL